MSETEPDIPEARPAFDFSAFDEERMHTIHPIMFGWIVLVFVFVTYQLVGGIAAYLVTGGETSENITATRLLTMFSQILLLLGPALVLVKMQPWTYKRLLSLRSATASQTLLGIFAVAALQIPMQGFIQIQEYVLNTWLLPESWLPMLQDFKDMISEMYGTIATAHSPFELAFVLLVVAITPALCEEFLFRGVVLGSFRRGTSTAWAIVMSGLAFGLFHLNPVTFIPLSILGIFLAWMTARSGSIVPAIVAHVTNNTIAIISLYFLGGTESALVSETQGMPGTALLTASLLSLAVLIAVISMFRAATRPQHQS